MVLNLIPVTHFHAHPGASQVNTPSKRSRFNSVAKRKLSIAALKDKIQGSLSKPKKTEK